jgi:hypothetical protein
MTEGAAPQALAVWAATATGTGFCSGRSRVGDASQFALVLRVVVVEATMLGGAVIACGR